MPKFRIRLESPDTFIREGVPHFRVTSLVADDEAAARAVVERREYVKTAHRLPDARLADLEDLEADAARHDRKPSGDVRAQLAIHRQSRPYEVVSVEEV